MKKIIAVVLACAMLVSFAACSKSSDKKEEKAAEEAKEAAVLHISDDKEVLSMSIVQPKDYVSVSRFIGKSSDGSILEKNLIYKFSDSSKLSFATSLDTKAGEVEKMVEQIGKDKAEKREIAGGTFYVFDYSGAKYALCQIGDVTYGVQYEPAEKGDKTFTEEQQKEIFDTALKSVKFTDNKKTVEDSEDIGVIKYSLDKSLSVYAIDNTFEESKDGKLLSATRVWKYGKDKKNHDFSFSVTLKKNTKAESEMKDGKEYKDIDLNGISYKACAGDENKNYEYITQQKDDVYIVKNRGNNMGWTLVRSDESFDAFDKFMQSISFGA